MAIPNSLLSELETAVKTGSKEKRLETLRSVTDLFLSGANRFSEEQIDVFDDVLERLIERIELKARAELSNRLAPISNAPAQVIRRLAWDDDIAVAGPVLQQSSRLTSVDLIQVARSKSQSHLLAISHRPHIDERVTDVLIDRGDSDVLRGLAANADARFSDNGYSSIVKRAEGDDTLMEKLGLRLDLPIRLLRDLLLRATEAVRKRLLAAGGPDARQEIQKVLAGISSDVMPDDPVQLNYGPAVELVDLLKAQDQLNEAKVLEFALSKRFPEVVAAIAALSTAQLAMIDKFMTNDRIDAILVPCKAAGMCWATVRAILRLHPVGGLMNDPDLASSCTEYNKLSRQTAERVLRFWQVRQTIAA